MEEEEAKELDKKEGGAESVGGPSPPTAISASHLENISVHKKGRKERKRCEKRRRRKRRRKRRRREERERRGKIKKDEVQIISPFMEE
jgi:hypothetical protein